jgi:hypothetical protein
MQVSFHPSLKLIASAINGASSSLHGIELFEYDLPTEPFIVSRD